MRMIDELHRAAQQKLEWVMAHREEILTAFHAKYGLQPDEIEVCEQRMDDGETRWFVRRRDWPHVEKCEPPECQKSTYPQYDGRCRMCHDTGWKIVHPRKTA